jgi:hypothetical protein
VGYKDKLAVVLFARKAQAQACVRDQDGRALGDTLKVSCWLVGWLMNSTYHCLVPGLVVFMCCALC